MEDLEELHPLFVGPYAENAGVLKELLEEFINDHVYWRRNFHPESTPPIPTTAQYRDDYIEFVARMKQELYRLSADLKKSVPFFSPRYVGHMASDLLLPGLIAKLVTTLYNPNNVAEDAAPATLQKELEVGMQLAEMFGYPLDEEREPCAWGHLTSGGTVANYEGLRNITAVRLYPPALKAGLAELEFEPGQVGHLDKPVGEASDWELVNLTIGEVIELRLAVFDRIATERGPEAAARLGRAVSARRVESLGNFDFLGAHAELKPPRVIVPTSAHYSWEKAMKVLGFGTRQLVDVHLDKNMRMDAGHLREVLQDCLDDQVPVLAVVGILGNTEFGTVDPLHEIVEAREDFDEKGLSFSFHVDAAWGGYLTTVFRRPDGELHSRDVLRKKFHYFPSQTVYDSFAALAESDSITVDPHKLGYVPYAAGAYVARDRRMVDFIAQEAAYVFDVEAQQHAGNFSEKLLNLGQYILEGSKAGSAAASVHVTHRVLPLHSEGFGKILEGTIRASEYFFDRLDEFSEAVSDVVRVEIPFEPDSNLVCLAINPRDNDALAEMNRFGRALFEDMKVEPSLPIQQRAFIVSYTSLLASRVPAKRMRPVLEEVGIDPETFGREPENPERDSDHVFLLRNTLMNPWLLFQEDGKNYIDRYFEHLEELIRAAV
ncbi:MAG: pyridoxal phosphate-dependent decarboxylase family protein [Myxococcota bacterium]